jgi:hypothetical protein
MIQILPEAEMGESTKIGLT